MNLLISMTTDIAMYLASERRKSDNNYALHLENEDSSLCGKEHVLRP